MQYIVQNYTRYYMKARNFSTNFNLFIIYAKKIKPNRKKTNLVIAYLIPYLLTLNLCC